jgi:hypothetical protein
MSNNNINIGCPSATASVISIGSNNIAIGTSNTISIASGGGIYSWRDTTEDMSEFVEFALKIMGVDLTFEEFKKMDGSERRAFIRDIKIDKIIK